MQSPRMDYLRLLGLLSLFAVAGCSQPSFLASFADQSPPAKERINPGTAAVGAAGGGVWRTSDAGK